MPGRKRYDEQENYILDSIDSSGYDDKERPFIEDKLKFCYETFMAEYGWNVKQVGLHKALTNWLSGLPSSCNIEWRNHAILQLGEKWKLIKPSASDTQQHHFLNTWFSRMAMRIITLWKRHDIK